MSSSARSEPVPDAAPARTVLVGVHHGFSVRYLLQTDIFQELSRRARVVIVAEEPGSYLDEFRASGVEVEVVSWRSCEAYFQSSLLQAVLKQLRYFIYGRRISTGEILWRISVQEGLGQARGWRRVIRRGRFLLYRAATGLLERSRTLRRLLLAAECRLFCPSLYDGVLERYRPDAVVVSSLGTFDYDQYLMRAARLRGIPVVAVLLSWDNTTTRGYPGAVADRVITWTEVMKQEVVALHDYRPDQVVAGGVAHFDRYWRPDPGYDREALLRGMGADPQRRIVFVATRSPNSYPYNPNIAEMLAEAVRRRDLAEAQIVVRIHPLHYRREPDGGFAYADVLAAFDRVAARYPEEIVLNVPSFSSHTLDYAMPESEIVLLSRLLRAADVIVTVFSTINIEGAIFDKPLVNVCFEDLPLHYRAQRKARFDIVADSQAVHNRRIIESGGIAVVRSPEELIARVAEYMRDPGRDRGGRQRIVAVEAGPHPGRAGCAIAEEILSVTAGAAPP